MEDKVKEKSFYAAIKNNLLNRYKEFLEKESLSNIVGTFLGIGISILVFISAIFIYIVDDISFPSALGSAIGFLLGYFILIFGIILGMLLLPYRIYKGMVSFDKSTLTNNCHKNLIFLGFALLVAGANEGKLGATLPLPFSHGGLDLDFVKGFIGVVIIFTTLTLRDPHEFNSMCLRSRPRRLWSCTI